MGVQYQHCVMRILGKDPVLSGSESSLQSCRTTSSSSCSHSEDASVRCSGSSGELNKVIS